MSSEKEQVPAESIVSLQFPSKIQKAIPSQTLELSRTSSPASQLKKTVAQQIYEYNLTQKVTVRLYDDLLYRFLLKLKLTEEKAKKIALKNHKFIVGKRAVQIAITLFFFDASVTYGIPTESIRIPLRIAIALATFILILSHLLSLQFEVLRALLKVAPPPSHMLHSLRRGM